MKLMGETGMNRDLMMDYTERSMNIGFQKELRDALLTTPGYKATLMERIKGRVGQMVLNNEANYINAHLGDMVFDAVKRTQKNIEGRLAAATTDAERAQWQIARNDPAIMLENIREMETARLGRYATDNEVGRRYLFELIDNAQLEERTPEQWLKFEAAITDGNFKLPASVGQVQPLPLDFLSQRLEFPNIHNVEDLRAALRAGTYTMDTVKERMGKLLYHPDAIKQIETSILFNWRHYFDGLRGTLGMSRREMAGIEDMFVLAARKLHMTGEEYVSQILPMTSHASTRVSQAVEAARAAVSEPSWVAGEAGKVPETLAELAKGEGATLDARTGQMVVAKKGYQVGYGAHPSSTVLEPGFSEDELRAAYEKASASGAPHVGLFRDNSGRLHVEPSETITSKVQAHATGQVRGENYLYDWKAAAEGHEPNLPVRPSYTQEGLDQNIKDTLEVFRLIEKGKAGLPEVTRLATSRFHPSLKNTLLDYFEEQLNGKKGLIAQAIAAGDTTRAADLESIRQALSEGWGPAADDQFRRLILKRIGGEVGEDGGSVRLVPEGFTTNPDEVIGGYNYPLELKRDGIFHVTTASDAVDREGLKSIDEMGVTPEDLMEGKELNTTGFGSKGDTNMIGRTAVSFDRNVANRLLTRMKMSVEVAQGKVSLAEVKAYFEPIYREAYGADGERILAEALGEVVDTPEATYAVMQRLSGMLPGGQGTGLKMTFEHARSLDPDQIALKELAVRRSGGLSLRVGKDFGGGEFDLPTKDLRVISPEADRTIAQADVERGVRYFSEFVQSFPKYQTGAILKDIASHIPVDGAAPYNYTHALLLRVFQENWRLAERDAIRLAYMSSERTVLERSLNHPLLAMYPSSYFFGKVVPETFRFLAMSPFGIDTGAMAEEYYKVQQSIGLQSQYDPGMEQLWNHLGKSAVMALMSYLTPSFPWDDMRSNLPPWVTSLAGGADAWTATKAQMDMMSPERWIKKPVMAAGEVGQMWAANNPFAGQGSSLSGKVQEELNAIGQQPAGQAQPGPVTYQAPTKGVELGSTLEEELRNLEQVLAGR